jgi:hypothetical protein
MLDQPERVRLYMHYWLRMSRIREDDAARTRLLKPIGREMKLHWDAMTRRDRDWCVQEIEDFQDAGSPADWTLSAVGAPVFAAAALMMVA